MKTNPKAIATLSSIAIKASQGLETCSTCSSGACCKNNRTLMVNMQEIIDRKHLLTDEVIAKTKSQIEDYKATGFFTCPFFDDDTNLCTIYSERFYTCASFLVLSEPIKCSYLDSDRMVLNGIDRYFDEVEHKDMLNDLRRVYTAPKVNFIEVIDKFI